VPEPENEKLIESQKAGSRKQEFSPGQHMPERRKVAQMVNTLRIWRLTELLDLDEEANIRFFSKLNRLEDRKKALFEQRRLSVREMKRLLKEKPVDQEGLEKVIDNLQNMRSNMEKAHSEFYEEIKKELSPEQLAKYLIFKSEFQQEIRNTIRKIKQLEDTPRDRGFHQRRHERRRKHFREEGPDYH
jgi:hypothetical protein